MADRVQSSGNNTATVNYSADNNPNPICVAPQKPASISQYSEQKIAALKQLTQYRQERAQTFERFLNDYPILSDILSLAIPPERQVCKPDQEDSLHFINSALAYAKKHQGQQVPIEEPSTMAQVGGALLAIALFPLALSGCSSEPEPSNSNYDNNDYVNVDKDNDHFCSDPSDYNCDYPENPKDCNDYDGNIYPEADEVLSDGIDQNCNGMFDDDPCFDIRYEPECCIEINKKNGGDKDCNDDDGDGVVNGEDVCKKVSGSFYKWGSTGAPHMNGCPTDNPCDKDGDGFKSATDFVLTCAGNDCDDKDPNKYPGHGCAADTPANNCDEDKDGYKAKSCGGSDCNDQDASKYPGHGCLPPVDCDVDKDGYPSKYNSCGGNDCDDGNEHTHPGSDWPEPCGSNIDWNCDGKTDSDCCLPDNNNVIPLQVVGPNGYPDGGWFQSCDYIETHETNLVCFNYDDDIDLFSFTALATKNYSIMRSDCAQGSGTISTCVYPVNAVGGQTGPMVCDETYTPVIAGQKYQIRATGGYGPYGIAVVGKSN